MPIREIVLGCVRRGLGHWQPAELTCWALGLPDSVSMKAAITLFEAKLRKESDVWVGGHA